jgi:soluble lytic murein transglycosylase-like protein
MDFRLVYCFVPALLVPGAASACWEAAAQKHAVPAPLLVALAHAESSLNPRAINRSHFHKTNSVDIGLMQINANPRTLKNLGVTAEQLFDPCTNIEAGARILAEKFALHGRTWEAVGAYNASCATMTTQQCLRVRTRYAWRVYRYLTAGAPAPATAVAPGRPPSTIVHVRLG